MGVGEDGQRATWAQDALSSAAGAIASITVAQPLDVIKVSHPCEYILYIIWFTFESLHIISALGVDTHPEQTIQLSRVGCLNYKTVGEEWRIRRIFQGVDS